MDQYRRNGKLYVHTTDRLYCFGNKSGGVAPIKLTAANSAQAGKPAKLVLHPSEFLLRPGESVKPTYSAVDAAGNPVAIPDEDKILLESWIPPTAKVKARLNAELQGGAVIASTNNTPSAGAYLATNKILSGTMRGRVLPAPPYAFDFNSAKLELTDATDNVPYAHPPLPWLGARLKWQVREDPYEPGSKVLAKTLDRVLFQRSMIFMGHADDSGYTVQADVMSDGNRRGMSVVGVINQRYLIVLDGNKQAIEVSSNHNRIAETADFKWKPKTWYTIKSMVVPDADGTDGTVYGKAWPRGEEEPAEWTIQVKVPNVHRNGSPGIYGFSPQSRFRVYVDNVKVDPNP